MAETIDELTIHYEARFTGFVNPRLVPVRAGGRIVGVEIEHPNSFEEQMLEYASSYSFLPTEN